MTSRWTAVASEVKKMSSVSPNLLLRDKTWFGLRTFLRRLEEKQTELSRDYEFYIVPNFRECTQTGLCVRYSHRVAWLALNRLIEAVKSLPQTGTERDSDLVLWPLEHIHNYLCKLFIPPQNMYHYGDSLETAADVIHALFIESLALHLRRLGALNIASQVEAPSKTIQDDTTNSPLLPIMSSVNNLLSYSAILDSYPVVPEDLAGTLVPSVQSTDTGKDINILKPGLDNRSFISAPKDPRPCVSCKLDNLSIGLTNIEEQLNKRPCLCILDKKAYFSPHLYQEGFLRRAAAISRLLLFNKRLLPPGLGCSCVHHANAYDERILRLEKALDSANVMC